MNPSGTTTATATATAFMHPYDAPSTQEEDLDIIKVLKSSNLTPSEKVSVITELNHKTQPSKNLSHVPCKFYRQGTCQAGNSCPFSHAMDIALDNQPCKYFQKGNCKFGIKCALAHILPDGRKVNTRNLVQPRRKQVPQQQQQQPQPIQQQQQQQQIHYQPHQFHYSPQMNYTFQPQPPLPLTQPQFQQQQPIQQQPLTSTSLDSAIATSPYQTSIWSNSPTSNLLVSPTQQNASLGPIDTNIRDKLFRSLSVTTPTGSISGSVGTGTARSSTDLGMGGLNMNASQGLNLGIGIGMESIQESLNSLNLNHSRNYSNQPSFANTNGSAIIDSEDDDHFRLISEKQQQQQQLNGTSNNNNDEELDFVPSSLNDLLTPQELGRRRSSQNRQDRITFYKSMAQSQNGTIVEDDTQFIMD